MSEQKLTPEEHRMMQDAFVFLSSHCCPPPNSDTDVAVDWWTQTYKDAGQLITAKWKNHMLIKEVLTGILVYLDLKAQEVSK